MKKTFIFLLLIVFSFAIVGCQEDQATDAATLQQFLEFAKKTDLQFTATYDVVSQGNEFVMTQYFKDENNMRTDMNIQGQEIRTFMIDSRLYSCNMQDEWICLEIDSKEMKNLQESFKDIEAHPENYYITYEGKKTVAGTTAYCFTITLPAMLNIKMDECFSIEAVPLYMKIGSIMEMEARSYELGVDENVFELPTEAQSMEEFMKDHEIAENKIDLSELDEKSLENLDLESLDALE